MAETMPRIEMASRQGSPFSNGIELHAAETKVLLLCHIFIKLKHWKTSQTVLIVASPFFALVGKAKSKMLYNSTKS
jgi:hypothetical protein